MLRVLGSFLLLTTFLVAIDFIPERPSSTHDLVVVSEKVEAPIATSTTPTVAESMIPTQITIDEIGLDTPIITPEDSTLEVLDRALLSGAVHYPESGFPGQDGNMLLFGHSSYLPVINNKAYKAFNDLNKLRQGDLITVYTETHIYLYETQTITLSEAEDVVVRFTADEPILTLSTCNSFGAKQERWIATATFISKQQR